MAGQYLIRWGWLRFMYVYTAIVGGVIGLGTIVAPRLVQATFGMPAQEPVVFGLSGSVYLAFAVVAIAGFRAPLKYCPILLAELVYKLIWLLGVITPLALRSEFPGWALVQVVVFITFVVGDLVAIPFRYVFAGEPAGAEGEHVR
jgi:hypothetical protein